MAQESCNLDKEEAEVLKPSSPRPHPPPSASSSSSSSSSPHSSPSPSPSPSAPLFLNTTKEISSESMVRTGAPGAAASIGGTEHVEESQPVVLLGNRCSNCRKRVGLTGFRCRCGDLFCARHRYSGTHNCSFDYKAAGREEISKANPLVRAAKIIKI